MKSGLIFISFRLSKMKGGGVYMQDGIEAVFNTVTLDSNYASAVRNKFLTLS